MRILILLLLSFLLSFNIFAQTPVMHTESIQLNNLPNPALASYTYNLKGTAIASMGAIVVLQSSYLASNIVRTVFPMNQSIIFLLPTNRPFTQYDIIMITYWSTS